MGALTPAATRETAALSVTGLGNYVALFLSGGDTEASGAPYVRVQTTWTAGTSDGVVTGSEVEISALAGTYSHIGIFNAASAGTLIDKTPLSSPVVLSGTGKVRVTPTMTAT